MNLKQLKAKGGIVDGQPVKKEVIWTHVDKSGKEVTDTFTLHSSAVVWCHRTVVHPR